MEYAGNGDAIDCDQRYYSASYINEGSEGVKVSDYAGNDIPCSEAGNEAFRTLPLRFTAGG